MGVEHPEVPFVDDGAAVQDYDAVRVIGEKRLGPGHGVNSAERNERDGIEIAALVTRQPSHWAVRARHHARRQKLAYVRVGPARAWKLREAAVGKTNQLVGRRRRPDHPTHTNRITF